MAMTAEEKREKTRLRQKKWYEQNSEKVKKRNKEWKKENPEKVKELNKKWVKKNPEKLNEKSKRWYKNNPEKVKERSKKYRENNLEKVKEKQKIWFKNNRDKVNKSRNNRYLTDNLFNLSNSIRNAIGTSFKRKNYTKKSRTHEILGCSFEDFQIYLENQFESWMNWENKGNPKDGIFELNKTWDIDHIIPISSATSEEEVIKLNHYTNLRPLCSYYNRYVKKHHLEEDLKKDLVDNL
jgi:hypothetical protein